MKIIITENQNSLVRRYHKIRNEVHNRMDGSNPCYYRDYHNFDKYKRDVLRGAIEEVIEEEGLEINPRSWVNFRNEISDMLNDEMKEFYDKEINERCPEYFGE